MFLAPLSAAFHLCFIISPFLFPLFLRRICKLKSAACAIIKLIWFHSDDSSGGKESSQSRNPLVCQVIHRLSPEQVFSLMPQQVETLDDMDVSGGHVSLHKTHKHNRNSCWPSLCPRHTESNPWQEGIEVGREETLEWIKSGGVKAECLFVCFS